MIPCQTQLLNLTVIIPQSDRIATNFVTSALANPPKETAQKPLNHNITLDDIFPTHQEENKIAKARRILEDVASDLSDEELEIYIIKFEFLLDTWLDTFEKQILDGKTLNQLLREG